MKKDREHLQSVIQRRIDNLPSMYEGLYIEGSRDAYDLVLQDIDQLDEPEVLSQEWIDEHKYIGYIGMDPDNPFVYVKDLQNLVVPKQELPVIPKYVGEFIEEVKASGYRFDDAFSILRGIYHQNKTADWVAKENRNSETFARAWLDGFEVEEEPLYYALIKDNELIIGEDELDCTYWNLDTHDGDLFPSNRCSHQDRFVTEMSKAEWNKLGINDSNADFVKVEEMGE